MKALNRRFCIAFVVLITLLAIVGCQPGSKEQAPSTPISTFTGSITFTSQPEEFEPLYIWWEEGAHIRNAASYLDADFSDDRLDGEWLSLGNSDGDKRSTGKNWTWGNGWGTMLVLGGTEELPVRWDGLYTGVTDEIGKSKSEYTLYGIGQNKGLIAKITCDFEYIGEPHSISELKCQGAMYEDK